jgi:hypothetical protein
MVLGILHHIFQVTPELRVARKKKSKPWDKKEETTRVSGDSLPTARIELTTLSLLVTRSTTEPSGQG